MKGVAAGEVHSPRAQVLRHETIQEGGLFAVEGETLQPQHLSANAVEVNSVEKESKERRFDVDEKITWGRGQMVVSVVQLACPAGRSCGRVWYLANGGLRVGQNRKVARTVRISIRWLALKAKLSSNTCWCFLVDMDRSIEGSI